MEMITVEIKDADKAADGLAEVNIICDSEGAIFLKKQIELLISKGGHIHLMTPSWAGSELSEKKLGTGVLVNHVRIIHIP